MIILQYSLSATVYRQQRDYRTDMVYATFLFLS